MTAFPEDYKVQNITFMLPECNDPSGVGYYQDFRITCSIDISDPEAWKAYNNNSETVLDKNDFLEVLIKGFKSMMLDLADRSGKSNIYLRDDQLNIAFKGAVREEEYLEIPGPEEVPE